MFVESLEALVELLVMVVVHRDEHWLAVHTERLSVFHDRRWTFVAAFEDNNVIDTHFDVMFVNVSMRGTSEEAVQLICKLERQCSLECW